MDGYRYRFVTTVDDVLEADAMARADFIQRWLVWLVGGLALFALLLMIFTSSDGVMRPLVGIGALGGLVYQFGIKPIRARRRIRAESRPPQAMRLEVAREGILIDVEGIGPVRRPWDDLARAADMKRGVLIYFLDGTTWLPQRVFADDDERRAFVEFVRRYEAPDTPP
jgi:hypothetical protein